jgi:TonB family protein
MKHFHFLSVCPALWLTAAVSAQTPSDPREQGLLKIIQTEAAEFPLSLRNSAVMQGEAKVAIDVDQKGQLIDWLVTGYSRKEFADSAVAALRRWRYEPPRLHGEPWASVQEIHFDYTRTGVVVSVTGFEALEFQLEELTRGKYAYRIFTLRELDRIPTPIQVVSPVGPALDPNQEKHVVTVEFYIDEEGRVRMPSVARPEAGDVCAANAMAAVKQWRFEPPLRKGRPVAVLVKQVFDFVAKP